MGIVVLDQPFMAEGIPRPSSQRPHWRKKAQLIQKIWFPLIVFVRPSQQLARSPDLGGGRVGRYAARQGLMADPLGDIGGRIELAAACPLLVRCWL